MSSIIKKQYFNNGDTYEGEKNSSGEIQGKGEYTYANGSNYKGDFVRGKFNGFGIFYDAISQTSIQGHFIESLPNGHVTIEYSDKNDNFLQKYEGQVQNGLKHGQGVLFFSIKHPQLQKYEGEFANDKFEGRGKLTFQKKGLVYEGQFQQGVIEGQGIIQHPDYIYKGSFKNGQKQDTKGTLLYHKSGDKYTGHFHQDQKNGKGKILYKDGTIYEGEFFNDKKHGFGALKYNNGDNYEGKFQNGLFQGSGKFKFAQNQQNNNNNQKLKQIQLYEGEFSKGKAEGQGRLQFYDSKDILQGTFQNNTKHGHFKLQIFKKNKSLKQDELDVYADFQGEFVYDTEKTSQSNYGERK